MVRVHSAFIIKNNNGFFPMKVLHRMLLARYGSRPAGHWVVMETVISEVPIMVMAHAWSQRGVSHVFSATGSAELHDEKHLSSF